MFVVDGYNLIHRDSRLSDVIDEGSARAARDDLVGMLDSFCEKAKRQVMVVFDGGRMNDSLLSRREFKGRVEVRYSSFGQTADSLIEEVIELSPAPADLHVVSDDKAVGRAIESHGAHRMEVVEFLKRIRDALKPAPGRDDEKPDLGPGEVDYWMKRMGLDEEAR